MLKEKVLLSNEIGRPKGQPAQLPSPASLPQTRKNRSKRSIAITAALTSFVFLPHLLYRLQEFKHKRNVQPLSPEFIANCHSLLDPPSDTYPTRLSNLITALTHVPADTSSATWIAEPGTSSSYFLGGFSSADWWLSERPLLIAITPPTAPTDIVEDQSTNAGAGPNITILTAQFEKARAELVQLPKEIGGWVTFLPWTESESPYEVLVEHLGKRPIVLDGQVRSSIAEGLHDAFTVVEGEDDYGRSTGKGVVKRIEAEVQLIRERKDSREVGLLRCANQFTLQAIRKTRARLYFGIRESQARKILSEELVAQGMEPEGGLVLFGENAALPHGAGTDRRLGKEDLILIDVGGTWGGYIADITRTFALPHSRIPKARLEAWETVRLAQRAVSNLILAHHDTPLTFGELDNAAREIISNWTTSAFPKWSKPSGADYRAFTHRTGHGIGLDGHESPYLVQGAVGVREVKSGHVFSIEPGIYLPARADAEMDMEKGDAILSGFGVRLEDCFVVHEQDGKMTGEWLSGPVERWGDV